MLFCGICNHNILFDQLQNTLEESLARHIERLQQPACTTSTAFHVKSEDFSCHPNLHHKKMKLATRIPLSGNRFVFKQTRNLDLHLKIRKICMRITLYTHWASKPLEFKKQNRPQGTQNHGLTWWSKHVQNYTLISPSNDYTQNTAQNIDLH